MKQKKLQKVLLCLILFSHLGLYAQSEYTSETKLENVNRIANITVFEDASVVHYQFTSNHPIQEWKAPLLEERLLITYTDLNSVSINSENQVVDLTSLSPLDHALLIQIVTHFKYDSYVEN